MADRADHTPTSPLITPEPPPGPPEPGASTRPRPLFVYGALCAPALLAWALTGRAGPLCALARTRARAHGLARFSLRGRDYPAAVRREGEAGGEKPWVDGYLVAAATAGQRRILDAFEGAVGGRPSRVAVTLLEGGGSGAVVDADAHLWEGDDAALTGEPWDPEVFVRERVGVWLCAIRALGLMEEEEAAEAESEERTGV
ncbi:hypothetical protein GGS23DRAFT_611308 [Durotheca rogersii]|uniref:uncharacterized protein n=1 Tax=Durotheca rogersii TaxID=419775 RepID=UPI0022205C98|nr:uncharacterized protein GGS23DRAFT_611308 [Durotheca rogersii]KAI5861700.1 hypothetical protein GGS23DRAFT_611308 [Durotheca rogersii]